MPGGQNDETIFLCFTSSFVMSITYCADPGHTPMEFIDRALQKAIISLIMVI